MDIVDELATIDRRKSIDKPYKSETISIFWLPVFVLPWCILYLATNLSYQTLPTPILIENEDQNPHRFIAERAKRLNEELTGIGPRVVGTTENEVLAIQFLEREILKIVESRNPIHNITYEIQRSSGSLELNSMTLVYNDIQNFVVKFTSADRNPSHCLLLNSHFDSVPISRGAGDSGTMVVVMLEVLRVISKNPTTFDHGIVFLFNGAEEVGLQGSHMFVTQHPWAADVRAVMNLDASGIGGREVMFRTTPKIDWLIKYYKENAIYPTATVLTEELFERNIMPSDSDFRIFRDYGNISGMDYVTYQNGYVYHTQFDRTDKIQMGTYQNVGDNILSIAKAIANAKELGDPNASDNDNPIYFDYIGWFMISYSVTVSITINVLVSLVCVAGIILSIWSHVKNFGLSGSMVSIQFGLVIIIQCVSIVVAAGVVVLLSVIYDACNRSMSYFSNPWIVLGIYYCPLMFCLSLGGVLHLTFCKKKEIHTQLYVQMYLHAQSILFILLILVMITVRIRSTFIVTLTLVFYTLTMFINFFSKLQLKDVYWTLIHFVGQVFPFMFLAYYTIFWLEVLVPVSGRSGPGSNPDSIIAVTSIVFGILMTGLLLPTFGLFKRPLIVVSGFMVVFLAFVIVMSTPVGFPFKSEVSPQRFWIFDTQRTFHNLDGSIRKADNGNVPDIVPGLNLARPTEEECETELFCGMPLYTNRMITQSKQSFWLPHSSPLTTNWPVSAQIILQSKVEIATNVQRFTFQISGPDHMALFISPKLGNKIINWNLLDYVPENVSTWGERLSYFVYLGYGGALRSVEFNFDIEINDSADGVVDIAVVGHYTHYEELETIEFQDFVKRFPDWTTVTPWMCTFESWVY